MDGERRTIGGVKGECGAEDGPSRVNTLQNGTC